MGSAKGPYCCPATGATSGSVWGPDAYTDDSNVTTAAVHAGKLTSGSTGSLCINVIAGQSSYTSTTRNGVTTNSYGSWSGSFQFQ